MQAETLTVMSDRSVTLEEDGRQTLANETLTGRSESCFYLLGSFPVNEPPPYALIHRFGEVMLAARVVPFYCDL